jgi:hypothetical protein
VAQAVPVILHQANAQDAKELMTGNTGKAGKTGKKSAALTSEAKESKNEVSFASLMNKVKEKLTERGRGMTEGVEQYAHLLTCLKGNAKGILENINIKHLISLLSNFLKGKHLDGKESDMFSALFKKLKNSSGEEKDSLLKRVTLLLVDVLKGNEYASHRAFEQLRQVASKEGRERNTGTGEASKRLIPKLVVIDMRKQVNGKNSAGTEKVANKSNESVKLDAMVQVKGTERGHTDTVLSFSTRNGDSDAEGNGTGLLSRQGQAPFDQQMVKNFRENLSKEMVKHTRIIVREDGAGELRIVLKPESLGNIRMRVNMQNNHIDGRIIVENNSIRNIVESALDNLQHALQQEGFDSISLKVSVGNEHGRKEEEMEKEPEAAKTGAIEEFEKNIPVLLAIDGEYTQVNLVV